MRKSRWGLVAALVGGGLLGARLVPSALGGFGGTVTSPSSASGSGVVAEVVDGSCSAIGPVDASTTCSSSSLLSLPGTASRFGVDDTGTLPEAVSFGTSSCGVATVEDTGSAGRTSVIRGAPGSVTLDEPDGPLAGVAASFVGSSGAITTVGVSVPAPTTFTEIVWLDAAPGATGPLMSFSATSPESTSGSYDRSLWIDPSGHLVAGLGTGPVQQLTSSTVVTGGGWHLAAVTVSGSSFDLYVDGGLEASDASTSGVTSYDGWWSLGTSPTSDPPWSDVPPASGGISYLDGSLAGAAVLPVALSATQVASLYAQPTFAGYESAVEADAPLDAWMLQDPTPTVDTSPPGAGGDVCASILATVAATVGGTTSCVFPVGPSGTGCPAASDGVALDDLSPTSATLASPLPPGASADVTVDLAVAGSAPASLAGALVVADVTVTAAGGTWQVEAGFPESETEL